MIFLGRRKRVEPPAEPRPSGVTPAAEELAKQRPRTLVGRFLRTFIDPWVDYLYWRLDLNGPNGRPVHSKVLSTIAFVLGCMGIVAGGVFVLTCTGESKTLMLGFLLAYSALVFSLPFGLSGFKVWATTKGGGTAEAFGEAAKADAQVRAAIERRRASVPDGTFEPT